MKKILMFVCLGIGGLKAQNSLVSNAQLNILYAGLNNEIKVMSCKVAQSNIILTSDVGTVNDSAGRFYVQLPFDLSYSVKTTKIRLYDRSANKKDCIDSFEFRIKRIQQPFIQLGSLSFGGVFRSGEIAIQQRLYAVIPGFLFDGVKYNVVSYRVRMVNTQQKELFSMRVYNNSTTQFANELYALKENARLEFDDIRYVLVKGSSQHTDTLTANPIVYYINFDGSMKKMSDYYSNCKEEYSSKTYNFSENGKHMLYTEDFKCVGKDTIILSKKWTTVDKITHYESYNTITGQREMTVVRYNDTSYNINYYKDGHLFAVGTSRNFQLEMYPIRWYSQDKQMDTDDALKHFIEEQYLQPYGTWRFFGPNMQLIKEGVLRFNKAGRGSVEWVK
jgi:hypothetical protein